MMSILVLIQKLYHCIGFTIEFCGTLEYHSNGVSPAFLPPQPYRAVVWVEGYQL